MGNADAPVCDSPLRPGQVEFSSIVAVGSDHGGLTSLPQSHLHNNKSVALAYLLSIPPLGVFGVHHFYLGRPEFGLLYLFTGGLALIGWFLDLFRMPLLVKEANERRLRRHTAVTEKSLLDAYILWMPFGLLGFHHYYLGRWPWAVAYTFTAGLAGLGWLFDGCRMNTLVREANDRQQGCHVMAQKSDLAGSEERRSLVDAYVLGLSLFGLLGAHHYYMGRFFVAIIYTFSGGLAGIGWIYDWFAMPSLFKRSQRIRESGDDGMCYMDDAYRFLWPFGFLGLHHFYLRRPGWGCLYLFTLGLLSVGWLVDFFRLPSLVREANKRIMEEKAHLAEIQERLGPNARVLGNDRYYVAYHVSPTSWQPGMAPGLVSSAYSESPDVTSAPLPYPGPVNTNRAYIGDPATRAPAFAVAPPMSTICEVDEEDEQSLVNPNEGTKYQNDAFSRLSVS